MAHNKENQSSRRNLKYKLRVAVSLMSILPILACAYLISSSIFPQIGPKPNILITIIITVFIALIGFILVMEIFDCIMSVTSEAKLIAAGDINRKLDISREDELGDLGVALNQLTERIRSNMDELESYGEKTAQINIDIQKRVLILSSLLQISSLLSQGAYLDDILRISIQKACLLANSESAFLLFREREKDEFYMKVVDGTGSQHLLELRIKEKGSTLEKLFKPNEPLVADNSHKVSAEVRKYFYDKMQYKNVLVIPIYIRGNIIGILGIGNNKENFSFVVSDSELLDIFAKQISIAVENDILTHKVEKLEIKDVLTGLYNKNYIFNRLQEEIKRAIAYQRPCAFVLFNIDDFKKFYDSFGSLESEVALKRIASLIKDSVSDIDRVARFSDNEFAILLPEKNKRQAQEAANEIRKKVEFAFSEERDINKRITVSAGISENPLDGITSQELINKTQELLQLAKTEGKNRVFGISGNKNASKENNK